MEELNRDDQEERIDDLENENDLIEVIELNEPIFDDEENEEYEHEEEEEIDTNEVEQELDNSIQTIEHHQGAVFTIDTFKDLIVSGGEDDKAFLWKKPNEQNSNYNLSFEFEKFQDSVVDVKFSNDGRYVAIADMSGNIRVYFVDEKTLFWSNDIGSDVELIKWHPKCNVLFCGTADGSFYMFKISTNEIKVMYSGDDAALSCFTILDDGVRAVCAYNNGNVRFWDLKSGQTTHNFVNAHKGDIICMDLSADGNLIATGGSDMNVHIINTINGKHLTNLNCKLGNEKEEESEENSIESVKFCKTIGLIACGTLRGQLLIWDLNNLTIRNKLENNSGISKLVWDKEILFASFLNGSISVYDGRNLELIKKLEGHKSEILDFSISGNFVISASEDKAIKVFDYNSSNSASSI